MYPVESLQETEEIFAEVHESALEFARGVGVKKCAELWGGGGGAWGDC